MPTKSEVSDFERIVTGGTRYQSLPEPTPPPTLKRTHKKDTSRDLGSIGGHFEPTPTTSYASHLDIDSQHADVATDDQALEGPQNGSRVHQPRSHTPPPSPETPTRDHWAVTKHGFDIAMAPRKEENGGIWDDALQREASPRSTPPGSPHMDQDHDFLDNQAFAFISRALTDVSLMAATEDPSMTTSEDGNSSENGKYLDHRSFWLSEGNNPYDYPAGQSLE